MDGVDTRDPQGGSAWTFFNQNLIQEIQIGGLGAPAEYGGFTGAIINTVTKSGGNAFSGLFSMRYTSDSLASNNIAQEVLDREPGLGDSRPITKKLMDYTVQMGGPLKKDKAFFFVSIQRYSATTDPTGPVATSQRHQPALQHEVHAAAVGERHGHPRHAVRHLQRHRPRQGFWPAVAGDRPADGRLRTRPSGSGTPSGGRSSAQTPSSRPSSPATAGYYYLDPVDPSPFTYDADTDEYTRRRRRARTTRIAAATRCRCR